MEEKINLLYNQIVDRLKTREHVRVSTCNHSNWDITEHMLMPKVTSRLQADGYEVMRSINFGVTDYDILAK